MTTIEDRLREGARDVQAAIANMEQRTLSGSPGRPQPAAAFVGVFLAVLMIGLMVVMLRGESASSVNPSRQFGTSDSAGTTTLIEKGEIPGAVLEYWALEGTLQSVGDEEGWLCPAISNEGYSRLTDPGQMPPELEVSLPGYEPLEVYSRDHGPVCHQPHVLVMLALTDGETLELAVDAGMTVWPQVSRFEDCEGCTFVGGPVTELTLNDHPARLHLLAETGHISVWWVDPSGTPMYAESSGLDQERVLELVGSIRIDPVTHRARVDAFQGLQMLSDQESVGVWENGYSRSVIYDIDGNNIQVTTTRNASFNPYARFAPDVEYLELVQVHDRPAVWIPEAGNFLIFGNGIEISIEGAPTLEEALALAEQLG